MYKSSLENCTVKISTPDVVVEITYPQAWMALNAYRGTKECCTRFSNEPDLNPGLEPKIYVYGEMHTWQQYLKRLVSVAEKIGAVIQIKGE